MKNKNFLIILFIFLSLLNLHSNHLLYLESKIIDINTIQKAYSILGEILKKVKKEVKNNYSPEEKLNKIYNILKNDFNFNYNESGSDLFSKSIISKNTKCDTGSFIFITIV